MSVENITYEIRFSRPRDICINAWCENKIVGKIEYRPGLEYGISIMCRLLKNSGNPDGFVVTIDNETNNVFSYHDSMFALANILPNTKYLSQHIIDAVSQISSNKNMLWSNVSCQNDLVGRDFVIVNGNYVTLSTLGEEVLANNGDMVANETSGKIILTANQREGFHIVANNPENWNDMHGRTKNFMIEAGWVELVGVKLTMKPVLTALGNKIYQSIIGDGQDVSGGLREVDGVPENIVKSLMAIRDKNAWSELHHLTRRALQKREFIVINADGSAKLNFAGQRAIDDFVNVYPL